MTTAQSQPARPVALVTGASRGMGIGAAICRRLAANGFDIAFTHWQPYDWETGQGEDAGGPSALTAELTGLGAAVLAIEADHADLETPAVVIAAARNLPGKLTVLVNNAAYSTRGGIDTLTAADMDAHFAVNVRGMALLSQAFVWQWTGGVGGRIINLTSGQSLGPMPDELAYVASKGAVEAFTLSLSAGVAARGITVNAVDPGPTDTGWISDDLAAGLLPTFPTGRFGQPADVARLVAFLAGEEAEWITGQVIHSRGGFG